MLLGLALVALMTQGTVRAAAAEKSMIGAIGRLVVDDARLCTAFVVRSTPRQYAGPYGRTVMYENWLVSAGHCLGEKLIFRQAGANHEIVRIMGFSASEDAGFDILLLIFFTSLPMPTLEPAFGEYPRAGERLMLVGYGRNALMMRVGPLLRYDARGHMEIEGYASPGNSGGPVLIPGTRRVVGIGIETTLDRPQDASLFYCILTPCAVKPPYIAAHIDRLLGVASFR